MNARRVCITVQVVVWCLAGMIHSPALAQDVLQVEDLMNMDLEDLLNVEISVASKRPESLFEAPGVVVVVPRDEFEIYGDRNLHQVLQRQASVYTRSSFVYSDNLAAFRGDMSTHAEMHTLLLFNGRPIRESAQGHNVNMYMAFPLAGIESIELIRGPGSVLYGTNAFTGVVNLNSRTVPEQPGLTVFSAAGSNRYYETTVSGGGRFGDLGFVAAARVAGQGGYTYSLFDQAGVHGTDKKHDRSISGVGHLAYRDFTLDFFGSHVDAFTLGVQPFWSNPHHSICNKKLFANAGYRARVHDRMTLDLNVTYNIQENSLSSPAPMMIGTNTSDLLGEMTLFADPLDNLSVVLGYLQEYRMNYEPEADHFQSIPPYHYSPKSAYAQGDYKVGTYLKLIAGTQWNESSQDYSDFVSRYGAIITPFDRWGVKFLRGQAFRAPVTLESDLNDPPILVGNKNLKPETIVTYDAQLFYNGASTHAAVTYFNSAIDGLIIYDAGVSPMSYMNGGEQKFDGIEVEATHYFTPDWHVLGSYTHQENEADVGVNPSVVPKDMAKIGTGYASAWWDASFFYSYFGKPPTIESPLVVNPAPEALNLVTLNVRTDPSGLLGLDRGRMILSVRVENALNEEVHVPTFAYTGSPNSFPYGPGTAVYADVAVNF
ncbi:MAG: TonB-dependent receptor [Candidatus Eisenbacteria bacterium]